MIRTFAVPVILGWVAVIVLLNLPMITPQLEAVGQMRAVSMSPADAPSMMKHFPSPAINYCHHEDDQHPKQEGSPETRR